MQTCSYASARWGQDHLSHVLLRENTEIVAAAQVVTNTMPFLGAGVSRVRGGPIWQLRGSRERSRNLATNAPSAAKNFCKSARAVVADFPPPALQTAPEQYGCFSKRKGSPSM